MISRNRAHQRKQSEAIFFHSDSQNKIKNKEMDACYTYIFIRSIRHLLFIKLSVDIIRFIYFFQLINITCYF